MFISHKNPGDKLSITAAEWNTMADAVNMLKDNARTNTKAPTKAVFVCHARDDRTSFQAGDILAYLEADKLIPLQSELRYNRVCFHDWCGKPRHVLDGMPLHPIYVMALSGGQNGSVVPVVDSGIVNANLSSALDDYPADGVNYFGSTHFAEVDLYGKLYPVNYQTSIRIISIDLNTRRVLAYLNCGVRPFGQFDTRIYPYEGKWRIACYNSRGRNAGTGDAGYVVGKGINGYVPSIDIDIPDIGSGLTVQYKATWERPDDESPGQYTKHQLEIVSGTNSPHYAAGWYTEVIATVAPGALGKPCPHVFHHRPLGNILIPDITY